MRINQFVKDITHRVSRSDEKFLWGLYIIFSLLYFLTYINASNLLYVDAIHDDELYYWMAQNINEGNWLGKYMPLTLAKVPSYAMFLAFSMKTGIPYLWLFSICHIIAVTFLLVKSKYLFKGLKWLLPILGFMLLFNPILASALRIYRFQLPAILFLVFIASLITLFNPAKKKLRWTTNVIDGLVISISWGLLWFSREEYLFYIGCLIVAIVAFLLVRKRVHNPVQKLYPLVYGVSGVIVFWLFISGMNLKHYGRFVVCEKTSSPYTDVIKTFNSIADPDFPQNVSGSAASREKIITIGNAIPMFRPMAENLIKSALGYRGTYFNTKTLRFVNEPDNTMTISHFEWAWISAAANTGYYKNATTLADYYIKLNTQLINAIKRGKLSTRKNILTYVGPYALSEKDISSIIKLLPKNYFALFPTPVEVSRNKQNLLIPFSPVVNRKDMEIWKKALKLNYITKGDDEKRQKEVHSFSNVFWNKATTVWAYTGMPLVHLAIILPFLAFLLSIIRKQWIYAAIVAVVSSTYIAHYLMLTVVSIISGFNAAIQPYFLPSYHMAIISAFLSISILYNLLSKSRR